MVLIFMQHRERWVYVKLHTLKQNSQSFRYKRHLLFSKYCIDCRMSFILFFRQSSWQTNDVNILLENLPNLIMEEAPSTFHNQEQQGGRKYLGEQEEEQE